MTSTAVARQTTGAVQLFGLPEKYATPLEQARAQIEPFLPRGISFESVMADCYLATRKNPELLRCDPMSLVDAVTEVQQRGLRIGSTCHLVPKGGKVCAWNDYRGDIEMIIASGACRDVDAHVVYENEPFHYVELLGGPELRHEVIFDAKARGAIKGVYAKFYLGGNRWRVTYMAVDDVDAIRQSYSLQWKKGAVPPWYMLKTCIRQGAKLLPKNRSLLKVYEAFTREEQESEQTPALGATARMIEDAEGETVDTRTGEILDQPALGATAEPEPEKGTLEWARAYPLPWRNSDQFGTPIGDFSKDHITSIATWCENRINAATEQGKTAPSSVTDLYNATQLILEAIDLANAGRELDAIAARIEKPEATVAEEQIEADVPERERPAPGSLRHDMPKPGLVSDALPLDDRRAKPNRNAQID